jgi:class 3 adenylate cyclase
MSPEVKTESELEIAHVLFIDTVGYSKLLINEQREVFDALTRVVKESDQFRKADAAGNLVRLPTGDGMALVFSGSLEAPAQCALEISKALRDVPSLPLRMGIHSGLVSRVVDVNNQVNIAGAGINIAQRVMNCGDRGHILLSKRAADDLVLYRLCRRRLM